MKPLNLFLTTVFTVAVLHSATDAENHKADRLYLLVNCAGMDSNLLFDKGLRMETEDIFSDGRGRRHSLITCKILN